MLKVAALKQHIPANDRTDLLFIVLSPVFNSQPPKPGSRGSRTA